MAVSFTPSNLFLNLATAIDLTSSPQLLLTNSSTYDATDNLTTVATEEVSGSGYARINLTVLSNSVQPGGEYKLIYNPASLTPSGGSITFDRLVLISGTNWIGYWDYKADNGGTAITIANGQTYPFKGLTIARGNQGTQLNGANGDPAWTTTTASFVQPVYGGTVSVNVGQTNFMAVGSYVFVDDGTNQSQYKITAIGSGTNVTLQRTTDEVATGTTVTSGATVVPSGSKGQNAWTLTTASFTQPAVGSTVTVSVQNSEWVVEGSAVRFDNGTNQGNYIVDDIVSETSLTLENSGGGANSGVTMGSGGKLVLSGGVGSLKDSLVFDDPAAITAMAASKLVDGMFYACSDTGSGNPGWYQYKASSSATLDSPNVIDCTNGSGRFVLFGGQGGGGGSGNIEYINSATEPGTGVDAPTYDGTSGMSFYIVPGGYGGNTYDVYIGVDTSGTDEQDGWLRIQNY